METSDECRHSEESLEAETVDSLWFNKSLKNACKTGLEFYCKTGKACEQPLYAKAVTIEADAITQLGFRAITARAGKSGESARSVF